MMSELCLLCDKSFVKFQFYYGPFDCRNSLIRKYWVIVKT